MSGAEDAASSVHAAMVHTLNIKLFSVMQFHNIRADLASHGGNWAAQGFWALVIYRFGRWRYGVRPLILRKAISGIYRVAYKSVKIVCGIDLPCEVGLGRHIVLDRPGGICISGYAKLGHNCRIRNGVVVGLSRIDDRCAPVIGNNVAIGTGPKLLGRITCGHSCWIGTNAGVIRDVPLDSSVVVLVSTVEPRRSSA